jgi:ClpP class serine protease
MHPSRKLGRGKTGCNGEAWGSGRGRVDNGHRDFAPFAAGRVCEPIAARWVFFGGEAQRRNLVDAIASESEVRLWLAEEAGKKPQPASGRIRLCRGGLGSYACFSVRA